MSFEKRKEAVSKYNLRRFFMLAVFWVINKNCRKEAFYAPFFRKLCARACNPNSISTF